MRRHPIQSIIARSLRPIVRLMVARGVLFPELAGHIKRLYVEVAERAARSEDQRPTDSRISVMTGLQRRDIARLRAAPPGPRAPHNHLSRLVSMWQTVPPYCDGARKPRPLPRKGPAPSFDTLAEAVRRDIHPRTQFEALLTAGTIAHDAETGLVTLITRAYIPLPGSAEQLSYFAASLGDHAMAGADNILAETPQHFERAVHYDGLSAAALAELEQLARDRQAATLAKINARAQELQAASPPDAKGRFRCGAYVYTTTKTDAE